MQSHDDQDAQAGDNPALLRMLGQQVEQLQARAERMTEAGTNRITAGAPGEPVLFEGECDGMVVGECDGMVVRRLPDDPLCLRISIGEVVDDGGAYLVLRGDPQRVKRLLLRAVGAIENAAL